MNNDDIMNNDEFTPRQKQIALQLLASLGGKAKAAKMTPEQRSEMARRMAQSRWDKHKAAHDLIDSAFKGTPVTDAERPFVFEDDANPTSR